MGWRFQLMSVAAAFAVLGMFILRYQRRASSCPRHRRWVGALATLAAYAVLAAAAILSMFAWLAARW